MPWYFVLPVSTCQSSDVILAVITINDVLPLYYARNYSRSVADSCAKGNSIVSRKGSSRMNFEKNK